MYMAYVPWTKVCKFMNWEENVCLWKREDWEEMGFGGV